MARSDEDIKRDVIDELHWDSRVDASSVTVVVENAIVNLGGEIPTYAERNAAVDAASAVSGIKEVVNKIRVCHPATSALPADTEIHEKIMTLLEWNPRIEASHIHPKVGEGAVTLDGYVETHWKRVYIEDVVANIRGVVAIHNNLTVVPTRSVTDQMIAEDIVSALRRDLLVDADEVEVNVENGVVTLSGQVMSQAERKAAEDDASVTTGVLAVRNRLVVGRAAA